MSDKKAREHLIDLMELFVNTPCEFPNNRPMFGEIMGKLG